MIKLYPFQLEGIKFLAERTYAILADEMGLGKTLQSIIAACQENKGIIIVCPAYLIGNWMREIKTALSYLNQERIVRKADGKNLLYTDRGFEFLWPKRNEIIVMSYNQIPPAVLKNKFYKFVASGPTNPVIIIADEAHFIRKASAQRSLAFRMLGKAAKNKNGSRIWLLTGTPILDRPVDIWALCQALNFRANHIFGSWDDFVFGFGGEKIEDTLWGGYRWGEPNRAVVEKLKKYILKRTKKEVLPDLPSKTIRRYFVKTKSFIPPDKLYTDNLDAYLGDGEITNIRMAQSYEKFLETEELINSYESIEVPLVVFSAFTRPVIELGKRPGWKSIYGKIPMSERSVIIDDFQSGKIKYLAGTIECLGTGHTLTASSNAIFLDLDWTPAKNWQAEDRFLRIGTKNAVNIIQVVGSDISEKRVNDIINQKIKLIGDFERCLDNV